MSETRPTTLDSRLSTEIRGSTRIKRGVKYQKLYRPKIGTGKRDFVLNPDEIVVVVSNSSRRATDEELRNDFGLIRCEDDCEQELAELEQVEPVLRVLRSPSSIPVPVVASTTSVSASATGDVTTSGRISSFDSARFPQQTQARRTITGPRGTLWGLLFIIAGIALNSLIVC